MANRVRRLQVKPPRSFNPFRWLYYVEEETQTSIPKPPYYAIYQHVQQQTWRRNRQSANAGLVLGLLYSLAALLGAIFNLYAESMESILMLIVGPIGVTLVLTPSVIQGFRDVVKLRHAHWERIVEIVEFLQSQGYNRADVTLAIRMAENDRIGIQPASLLINVVWAAIVGLIALLPAIGGDFYVSLLVLVGITGVVVMTLDYLLATAQRDAANTIILQALTVYETYLD